MPRVIVVVCALDGHITATQRSVAIAGIVTWDVRIAEITAYGISLNTVGIVTNPHLVVTITLGPGCCDKLECIVLCFVKLEFLFVI